jgi:hypothetical protein
MQSSQPAEQSFAQAGRPRVRGFFAVAGRAAGAVAARPPVVQRHEDAARDKDAAARRGRG